MFNYDHNDSPQGSCQFFGNAFFKGKLWTGYFTTPLLNVTNKLEVNSSLNTKTIQLKKGILETVFVDTIQGNQDQSVRIQSDLYVSSVQSKGSLEAPSFLQTGIRQWQLTHHDDFDDKKTLEGWSHSQINHCENQMQNEDQKNNFLGGHCHLSYDEVIKEYDELPEHSIIRMNANIHLFDNWEGETAYMKVNDKIVWQRVGVSQKNKKSLNICGNNYNDPAFSIPIDYQMPHNQTVLKLSFGSTLKKNPCEASFGVDDVMIYIK